MDRLGFRARLQLVAAAVCALCLSAPPAAQAASVFNVGPGGYAASVASHLPAWLQVDSATASLYAADASGDEAAVQLARHTFLRVLNAGISRLQVQAYDDTGAPAETGWIDPNQVMPSAPGTDWLVASVASQLWNSADPGSAAVRNLDRFTPLQKVGGPLHDRVEVRVYRQDFSGVVDQGWIDLSATGPALPPQMSVPTPTDRTVGLRSPSSTAQQQQFLDAAAQAARQGSALTGIPASVTVAQAILESDWGQSALAQQANNFFGIKAIGTLGNAGLVWMPTSEYDSSGALFQITSAFRAYNSLLDSMTDHDRLLANGPRYSSAMAARNDPRQFAAQLALDGYSTDPAYADKLVSLMDRYNLYLLDT